MSPVKVDPSPSSKGAMPGDKLIPVTFDPNITKATAQQEYLWPLNGDPKYAAENLCRRIGNEKVKTIASRQLETATTLFSDIAYRPTTPHVVNFMILKHIGNDVYFIDKIRWDINSPIYLADVYAAKISEDLQLGTHAAFYIGHELKYRIQKARNDSSKLPIVERMDASILDSDMKKESRDRVYPMLLNSKEAARMLEKYKQALGDASTTTPITNTTENINTDDDKKSVGDEEVGAIAMSIE